MLTCIKSQSSCDALTALAGSLGSLPLRLPSVMPCPRGSAPSRPTKPRASRPAPEEAAFPIAGLRFAPRATPHAQRSHPAASAGAEVKGSLQSMQRHPAVLDHLPQAHLNASASVLLQAADCSAALHIQRAQEGLLPKGLCEAPRYAQRWDNKNALVELD